MRGKKGTDVNKASTSSTTTTMPHIRHPQNVLESELESRPSLLCLPAEIRILIYRKLFSNLLVQFQPTLLPYRGPGAIFRVCNLCYEECVPIFYESVTIILKHELFLYVLSRRIGLQNMSLIRNIAVGSVDINLSKEVALRLPNSLRKICIGWKDGSDSSQTSSGWEWPASDEFIRSQLDKSCRSRINAGVQEMWAKCPHLQMWIEAWIGKAPHVQVRPRDFLIFLLLVLLAFVVCTVLS